MSSIDLRDRVVIVTGGTHGIGRAVTEIAVSAGARVIVAARNRTDVEKTVRASIGRTVDGIPTDVSQPEQVERLFEETVSRHGRVDAVIHAAGVLGPIGRIADVDPETWWSCCAIDLFGSYLVLAAACRRMMSRGGRIVMFSGGGATTPFPNYSAYAASKAAVVRLVETVALEYAVERIEINAVAPGFVATRMHQETLAAGDAAGSGYLERTKKELEAGGVPPELGAECACFLASDAAAGISGRIVAAPWDDWRKLPERRDQLLGTDLFTLRRIVPRDRGADWQ